VPTVRFRLLYVWFVIEHGRRQIRHVNVTAHPTSSWTIQQLREAFPDENSLRFLIHDNDARHLRRLLRDYVDYYNEDRVHTCLRDSPYGRPAEIRPSEDARVVGLPRAGGLHHRYLWSEAA
jgi:putative transposase